MPIDLTPMLPPLSGGGDTALAELYNILYDPKVTTEKIQEFSATDAGKAAWSRMVSLDNTLVADSALIKKVKSATEAMDVINNNTLISSYFPSYEVHRKVLYVSDTLVSETDTGARISNRTRKELDIATWFGPDWVGEHLWCKAEVYNDTGEGIEGWGDIGFAGSRGIRATAYDGKVVVQVGEYLRGAKSYYGCDPFDIKVNAILSTAKVRLTVTRLTYNNTPSIKPILDMKVLTTPPLYSSRFHKFDIATELGADWANQNLLVMTTMEVNGKWGDPAWYSRSSDSYGVSSNTANNTGVVVQAGSEEPTARYSYLSGSPFNLANSGPFFPAVCKVYCFKLNQEAIAEGVVETITVQHGNFSKTSLDSQRLTFDLPAGYTESNTITLLEVVTSTGVVGNPGVSERNGARSTVFQGGLVIQIGYRLAEGSTISGSPLQGSYVGKTTDLSTKLWRLG